MKIDQQDGLKSCEKLPREPGQAEHRRDRREEDCLDQRKREARHKVESDVAPPGFSVEGEARGQPPYERGEESPGECGCQPDHEKAVPLDGLTLKHKTTRILANKKDREQSPAAQIG